MNDKERTIEIPVDEFARLKSCEVKLEIITEAIKRDTSTYGLSGETEKLIMLIIPVKKEANKE